jgi:cobalt-zinc-cadmium efflux system membrane fusion protein
VVERPVTLGQMVEPKDTLFVIMDLTEVWIVVDVYERDLAQVAIGQRVKVRIAAWGGREFEGTIQDVGAVVEATTRAVKVRVVLPNPAGELKAGMFATVTIEATTGVTRERLVAPAEAVQRDGDDSFVFVPRGEREFEPRRVKVGATLGDVVEIEEGLTEGETVVTAGSFLLKSELMKEQLGGGHEH